MEVTLLCIRLLMTELLLLVVQLDFNYSQKVDEAFPHVVPNRQQHFEYESIDVSCEGLEGLTGWRVMRRIKGDVRTCASSWSTSKGFCNIKNAFPTADTGEYWCDRGGIKKSNTVNIIVTAGPVILESPVLPVTEADNVTLSCRKKQSFSNMTAKFYKDGHFMDISSTGNMTIHGVSKSNEGLYKCSISGAVESAESWLTVRAHAEPQPTPDPHPASSLFLLLCVGVGVFLVVLLLLVILLHCRKAQAITRGTPTSPPSFQSSSSPQTVYAESSTFQATYAVVTKPRNERDKDESLHVPVYYTLSLGEV